jgi:hypothetical protein
VHCGGCGQACQGDLTCLEGTCGCADAGDTKCGSLCVDIHDDDDHCGGCGQVCQGDLACLNSTCACAGGKTQCFNTCVNVQTDALNCGQCGNACGAGKSCQAGQCVTLTCGANELLCNGSCVTSIGAHPCCSQADCGGTVNSSNHISCDLSQHQCRCVNTNYGICQRTPDRRGICRECCEGGIEDLNCLGEMGCNGENYCTCPTGSSQCPGGSYRCYQDPANPDGTRDDPTTCLDASGNCMDCTHGGTKPYVCCTGRTCFDASGLEPNVGFSFGQMCGGCARCEPDKVCCNDGPNTPPKCKTPAAGGYCPLPDPDQVGVGLRTPRDIVAAIRPDSRMPTDPERERATPG